MNEYRIVLTHEDVIEEELFLINADSDEDAKKFKPSDINTQEEIDSYNLAKEKSVHEDGYEIMIFRKI